MRILVVDDHTVMRQGILRLLGSVPGTSIDEAGTAREAMASARRERPDVVVLDINLKESSGIELLKRMRLEWPSLRVVMFSMYTEAVYAITALRLGAIGFVSKSADAEELLKAVREAQRGHEYVDSDTAAAIAASGIRPSEAAAGLSNRELEIMRLLAEGKSLANIADTLGVAYKTVANQCTRIKEKLGLERTADLIRYALSTRAPPQPAQG